MQLYSYERKKINGGLVSTYLKRKPGNPSMLRRAAVGVLGFAVSRRKAPIRTERRINQLGGATMIQTLERS